MRAYRRVHTTKQGNTRADVYMCENAPDLGFRIHLTRTIDHECTSDRADLLKKSSYLHSPRIVGFRIKRRATGVAPCRRFPRRGQPSMSYKFIGNARGGYRGLPRDSFHAKKLEYLPLFWKELKLKILSGRIDEFSNGKNIFFAYFHIYDNFYR